MSNLNDIMQQLASFGSEQIKNIYIRHGAREPLFGVRVEDMKKLLRGNKGNNKLAAELFATGNHDAMYLAGLMADGSKMTPGEIRAWASAGHGSWIRDFIVPWVATENAAGWELAKEWIDSPDDHLALTGWATFSSLVSVWPDEKLDLGYIEKLMVRAERDIHGSHDRMRMAMNGFVIATGTFVEPLHTRALEVAARIGKVNAKIDGTACKVPAATDYINKAVTSGRLGRKRKMAKC